MKGWRLTSTGEGDTLHNPRTHARSDCVKAFLCCRLASSPSPATQPALPPLLDVSMSLQSNARRLVQARLGRAMTQPETETLDAALVEALGVLRVATDEDHRTALQLVALTSLSTPAGAHLWACLLDEAERTFQSVAAYAAAVVSAASAVASAQFAASLGL